MPKQYRSWTLGLLEYSELEKSSDSIYDGPPIPIMFKLLYHEKFLLHKTSYVYHTRIEKYQKSYIILLYDF